MNTEQLLRNNIKFLIEKSGKKKGTIEREMDLSIGYFSKLFSNNRVPDLQVLIRLSDYFKIDYNSLLCINLNRQNNYDEKAIEKFIFSLAKWTADAPTLEKWEKRYLSIPPSDCSYSPGMRHGFYLKDGNEVFLSNHESRYSEEPYIYICKLSELKICIHVITDYQTNMHLYELTINGSLIYTSIFDTSEIILKTLNSLVTIIEQVYKNLKECPKNITTLSDIYISQETMQLIKKYTNIQED